MSRNGYQYETSPRKLEPSVQKNNNKKRSNIKIVKDLPRQEVRVPKEQRKKQARVTLWVVGIFIILLTISYRNSIINEKFNSVQNLKKELATVQKENEQLKVGIENSLNLNNIEKIAKEKLGMQKLTNNQTIYITLPKKDYVESASEEVIIEKNKNWFEEMIDNILGK